MTRHGASEDAGAAAGPARQAARLHAHVERVPVPDAHAASRSRCSREEGLSLLEDERRPDPRGGRDRVPRRAGRARAVRRAQARRSTASACGSRAGSAARSSRRPRRREFTQVARNRANDVVFGGQRDDLRARVRLAVRPRPRRRPPLRDDRGLPELREARVRLAVAPPLGRHGLRAGRRAGQQAALRHGLRAHPLLGQAVHGLGHAARSARATRSRWPGSSSARTFVEEHTVDLQPRSTRTRRSSGTRRCSAPRARTPRRTRR